MGKVEDGRDALTMDDVALLQQELGEIRTILAAHARDQRDFGSHRGGVIEVEESWPATRVSLAPKNTVALLCSYFTRPAN